MNQLKVLLKRLAPSSPALITGAITSAVIYVANHVFHVHVLSSSVEGQLTPVISFLLASVVHDGSKAAPAVEAEVTKVEGQVDKVVEKVDPSAPTADSLVNMVAGAINARLTADPTLQDRLVNEALGHLLAPPVVPAPVFVKTTTPIAHTAPPAKIASGGIVTSPAPIVESAPAPTVVLPVADVPAPIVPDPAPVVEAPVVVAPTPEASPESPVPEGAPAFSLTPQQ